MVVLLTWVCGFGCVCSRSFTQEIIQNKGHDKAADWWTLGINLYEFMAGYPPFDGPTPLEIYRLIISGNYEVRPHHSCCTTHLRPLLCRG